MNFVLKQTELFVSVTVYCFSAGYVLLKALCKTDKVRTETYTMYHYRNQISKKIMIGKVFRRTKVNQNSLTMLSLRTHKLIPLTIEIRR